jgi:hypothetical protein
MLKAEGGARAVCVKTFVRSVYANQALLLHPPMLDYRTIALHWIERAYGHLRQGWRLLTSNCDFLQMQREKSALPPSGNAHYRRSG